MSEPELLPPAAEPAPPPTLPRTSGLAIASLVAGLLAWFSTPLLFMVIPTPLCTIAAIVCGHMARSELRRNPGMQGNGMAIAGLVLGYGIVAMFVVATIALLLIFGGVAAIIAYFGHGG